MSNNKKKVAVFSKGLLKKQELKSFLNIDEMLFKPNDHTSVEYVAGWGMKENTNQAKAYAAKHGLDYYSLEDGFLHSMGQGVLGAKSCSLVKDSLGIYYDATQSSDLEKLLLENNKNLFNAKIIQRASNAIRRITQNNISKYNNGSLQIDESMFNADEVVLVVDQTAGDMSLQYGYVSENTFGFMLQAALTDYPNAQIIVKTHPDVIAGKKKGSINLTKLDPRVVVVSENINPLVLLKKVDAVYVATSQMGFEALMLEKRVVCFGAPFYSGWGLTEDRANKALEVWKRRNQKRSLEELFAAAYIHYPKYIVPVSQAQSQLEDVLSYFEEQNLLKTDVKLFCFGFTRWKQNYAKAFLLGNGQQQVLFVASAKQARQKGFKSSDQIVTWASKNQMEANKLAEQFAIDLWQVEDGFIRSTGLGSDLTAPLSLVIDKTGIYYDPTSPSDLETILQNTHFSKPLLKRAENLKLQLLEKEISKYNVGKAFDKSQLDNYKGQKIILIPGQVEEDASIKKGCVDIFTNEALIKEVRNKEPDAYLVYKPHPDVVSGNRKRGAVRVDNVLYDHILLDANITDCLDVADEVHTMTSLVGFEGLLRELTVVCYGRPFYSGWGMTDDRHSVSRRTRRLTLNELVAGTLIVYPKYIEWEQGATTPEKVVEKLSERIESEGGKKKNQISVIKRSMSKLKNIYASVLAFK